MSITQLTPLPTKERNRLLRNRTIFGTKFRRKFPTGGYKNIPYDNSNNKLIELIDPGKFTTILCGAPHPQKLFNPGNRKIRLPMPSSMS